MKRPPFANGGANQRANVWTVKVQIQGRTSGEHDMERHLNQIGLSQIVHVCRYIVHVCVDVFYYMRVDV